MVGIEDKVAALEFDLTCTLRLQIYDNQRERDKLNELAILIMTGRISGGGGAAEEEIIPEAP